MDRRAPHSKWCANLWDLVGRHVDNGEALDVALVRECQEEVGLTPLAFNHLATAFEAEDPKQKSPFYIYAIPIWTGGSPKLLGTELTDPVDLGGSQRSTVLRVRRADGGTVILKAHAEWIGYAAESGGLAFSDIGPRLLGSDPERRLIAMEDLGDAPNLADLLLGGDEKAAREALVSRGLAR